MIAWPEYNLYAFVFISHTQLDTGSQLSLIQLKKPGDKTWERADLLALVCGV